MINLHPDRLFPAEKNSREIARKLYQGVKELPIISPHGHCDASWFANNTAFGNATELLVFPDHYVLRMLYSQGVPMAQISQGAKPRESWRLFARHYHCFRGTPSRMWLDHVFTEIFGIEKQLNCDSADYYFDYIGEQLCQPEFLPRALFERFNIEVLATTDSPLDSLAHHRALLSGSWPGRIIPAFRPDCVVDPEYQGFIGNVISLGEITGEDTRSYQGYLRALFNRRAFFKSLGATSTDHGHPTPATADLPPVKAEALFEQVLSGAGSAVDAELFRAQMLTEMAAMSLEDGLVMQIHPGVSRNHNSALFASFGRDRGADIPVATEYVGALKPLLDKFGNDPALSIVLFTLDETTYSRELAPLAGHYPCLKLGPPWWFHDSPEGMRRFRAQTTETAGFYNTVGFNDDTRAFMSIPARHDVARRMDCGFLAELVADHRLGESEAMELAAELSYGLAKRAYKL